MVQFIVDSQSNGQIIHRPLSHLSFAQMIRLFRFESVQLTVVDHLSWTRLLLFGLRPMICSGGMVIRHQNFLCN